MNPFLKKKVKTEPEDPNNSLDGLEMTPLERMDFWEGLATVLKQNMRDVKVVVWGDDNGLASIHITNMRSAMMEFPDESNIPTLFLHAGIPSNVAAKIALVVDKYCQFTLGRVFYVDPNSKSGELAWGSDALRKYFEDVYFSEKHRNEREKRESEKERPSDEPLH